MELVTLGERLRRAGKRIVWTNGCFDLLHVGHVFSLQAARELGDVLIVGINSDLSVARLKGSDRPIVPESERGVILAALSCVYYVTVFGEDTPLRCIDELRPDICCKGAEYSGRATREQELVESYGGRMVYLPMTPNVSTTQRVRLIQRGNR